MRVALWFLTVVGALLAGFDLVSTLPKAESAPQQAAVAAQSAAFAIVPYVLARAWSELVALHRESNAPPPKGTIVR